MGVGRNRQYMLNGTKDPKAFQGKEQGVKIKNSGGGQKRS